MWLRISFAIAAIVFATSAAAEPFWAFIHKTRQYAQTSATDVALARFEFGAQATQNVASPPPVLSGPVATALVGSSWDGGRLNLTPSSGWYSVWPSSTQADLDAKFPNGSYSMLLEGTTSLPITLTGDLYPNIPIVTITGGAWSGGKYVFDATRPVTISTNVFTGYGANPNDNVFAYGCTGSGCHFSAQSVPGSNILSVPFPANSFVNGNEYSLTFVFDSEVNQNPPIGAYAAYRAATTFILKAEATPVFPMTVNSQIGAVVSNATAQVQPRPQDEGITASVFSFFVAPSTKVLNAATEKGARLAVRPDGAEKAGASVECVLAQLNSSGQLQAVSAANLQAYVTGVLSGQGQTINMLNNVLTANVAGTALYVGYGQNALNMLTAGLNQRAVTIPGEISCDPKAPKTGWWWNPVEGGRGYSIEVAGNHIFFASYLYDVSGRATWYVGSGNTSLDGSLFTGSLDAYSRGQTLGGSYQIPSAAVSAGSLTLAFADASNGTMIWPGGTVPIQRFNIVPNGTTLDPNANQPESGWWWNPEESGRGYFLEWQGGELFMAGYMYNGSGDPIWYLSTNTTPSTNLRSYSGNWWRYGNGQTLAGTYKPATRLDDNVAPVTIEFSGAENAIMTLPGGRTTNIRRFRF